MPRTEPFEKYTLRYEDWFEQHDFVYRSELQAVERLLPRQGQGFEVGVGTGRFAAPLGIRFGVEPSVRMGRLARRRGIAVVNAVAEALPFADAQFDFALMVTTICFLDDPESALKEIYRVLAPGGSAVIGFIDKESRIGKQYQRHKNESVFYKIATFYTVDEVVAGLRKAGFEEFAFVQTIFHSLTAVKTVEPVRRGHGEGSFVVIKAIRQMSQSTKRRAIQ